MTYRVGIVGSRTFKDEQAVRSYVRRLPHDTVVVSGGCKVGPDYWAVDEAKKSGREWKEHPVDTEGLPKEAKARRIEYAKRAYARNQLIVDDNLNWLVGFWSPPGKGTVDTLRRAQKAHVPWAQIILDGSDDYVRIQNGLTPEQLCLVPKDGN